MVNSIRFTGHNILSLQYQYNHYIVFTTLLLCSTVTVSSHDVDYRDNYSHDIP